MNHRNRNDQPPVRARTVLNVESSLLDPANVHELPDLTPLVEMLEVAHQSGLDVPRMRFRWDGAAGGRVALKRATAGQSAYPGALQVKDGEGKFLGRIEVDGTPSDHLLNNPDLLAVLEKVARDPVAAAREYGLAWGN